jgi:very-short-patch-repair endonuclease
MNAEEKGKYFKKKKHLTNMRAYRRRVMMKRRTKTEIWALKLLTRFGIKAEPQKIFQIDENHGYYADIYLPECKIILELDGPGHSFPKTKRYDAQRTQELEALDEVDRVIRIEDGFIDEMRED